jgi:hypothetical protein
MKPRWYFSLLILWTALGVLLGGCQLPALPFEKSLPVESGDLLLEDDFVNPRSGWDTWENDLSTAAYLEGGLVLNIREPGMDYISRAHKKFADVDARVSAVKLSGTDDNDFGLVCRYQNAENFYGFLISSDGYAGIIKVKEGVRELISGDTMQYSELIQQGGEGNQLRMICLGSSLALFVNDTIILLTEDSDFTEGDVGVIAGGMQPPGVEVFFDDFKVYQP